MTYTMAGSCLRIEHRGVFWERMNLAPKWCHSKHLAMMVPMNRVLYILTWNLVKLFKYDCFVSVHILVKFTIIVLELCKLSHNLWTTHMDGKLFVFKYRGTSLSVLIWYIYKRISNKQGVLVFDRLCIQIRYTVR